MVTREELGLPPLTERQKAINEAYSKYSEQSKGKLEVFNFKENWPEVRLYLENATVKEYFTRAMIAIEKDLPPQDIEGSSELINRDRSQDPEIRFWDHPDILPCWDDFALDRFSEAAERGDFIWRVPVGEIPDEEEQDRAGRYIDEHCYPQPGSYQWYQGFAYGHYLAPALRELGQIMFPDMAWAVMTGPSNSFAYGSHENGIILILDILRFEWYTAEQIIGDTLRIKEQQLFSLAEWEEQLIKRGFLKPE